MSDINEIPFGQRPFALPDESPVVRDAIEKFHAFADAMVVALTPIMAAVSRACADMYTAIYSAYEKAGLPYGDSQEGCMRWFSEQAAISREQAEAEYKAERQAMIENLRQKVERT